MEFAHYKFLILINIKETEKTSNLKYITLH